ncbi:MAG: hypothetical protein ABI205_08480 [Gemmatimonadaceae bacterium]
MDSPSKLRMISRVAGTLALVVSLGRVWFAVVKHMPMPWTSVIASVLICAFVWWLPEGGQQPAQTARP